MPKTTQFLKIQYNHYNHLCHNLERILYHICSFQKYVEHIWDVFLFNSHPIKERKLFNSCLPCCCNYQIIKIKSLICWVNTRLILVSFPHFTSTFHFLKKINKNNAIDNLKEKMTTAHFYFLCLKALTSVLPKYKKMLVLHILPKKHSHQ